MERDMENIEKKPIEGIRMEEATARPIENLEADSDFGVMALPSDCPNGTHDFVPLYKNYGTEPKGKDWTEPGKEAARTNYSLDPDTPWDDANWNRLTKVLEPPDSSNSFRGIAKQTCPFCKGTRFRDYDFVPSPSTGKNSGALYYGVGGKAKKIKAVYVGVDGKAKKVKTVYGGVNSKAVLCFDANPSGGSITGSVNKMVVLNEEPGSTGTHIGMLSAGDTFVFLDSMGIRTGYNDSLYYHIRMTSGTYSGRTGWVGGGYLSFDV